MKFLKVFSIVALSAMALAANAENPQVKITLKGQNNAYAAELNLCQDAEFVEYSSPFSSDALNAESIDLYAVYGGKNYSTLFAADIDGVKIGFKGNSNTSYTMTFTGVEGTVKLYDAVEDSVIVVVNNGTYNFTATAKTAITDRFQVGEPAYTRDGLTSGDWGTICLPWASTALEGATFYETLGTKNDQGIALAEVSALEAGKPYVFNATDAEIKVTYNPSTKVTAEVAGEKCTGSFAGCNVPEGMYLIVNNELYKAAGSTNTIAANRAYFDVATMGTYTPAPGRKVVFFGGKGAATGLEAAEAPAMMNGKMILNGRMVIVKDGKMFNAQGAAL